MQEELVRIGQQAGAALAELLEAAKLKPGQLVVVGCSTSEVRGEKIGSAGSEEIARTILAALRAKVAELELDLAIQCCEHLNRSLVVEQKTQERYNLEEVSVVPVAKAGGALAARAMIEFNNPVVVDKVEAHAGLDIGATLIGMHLKRVAVPIRLKNNVIGKASVTAARTRPKLIGGARAVYELSAYECKCPE
jgi:uncharacterized protein (TIGR01440 family)